MLMAAGPNASRPGADLDVWIQSELSAFTRRHPAAALCLVIRGETKHHAARPLAGTGLARPRAGRMVACRRSTLLASARLPPRRFHPAATVSSPRSRRSCRTDPGLPCTSRLRLRRREEGLRSAA